MTEDIAFQQAIQASRAVGFSFHLIVISEVVAFWAVLIGGLPIAITVIKFILVRKQRGLLFGLWCLFSHGLRNEISS